MPGCQAAADAWTPRTGHAVTGILISYSFQTETFGRRSTCGTTTVSLTVNTVTQGLLIPLVKPDGLLAHSPQ